MATRIKMKASGHLLGCMFDELELGFKYFEFLCMKNGEPIYKVEIRGHEKELTENRMYSIEGFLKKLHWEFIPGKQAEFLFIPYYTDNSKRCSNDPILPIKIKTVSAKMYSLAMKHGIKVATNRTAAIMIYRKTRKGDFALLDKSGIEFIDCEVPPRIKIKNTNH